MSIMDLILPLAIQQASRAFVCNANLSSKFVRMQGSDIAVHLAEVYRLVREPALHRQRALAACCPLCSG